MEKLISFEVLAENCNYLYTGWCEKIESRTGDKKCSIKNCPVWKKLEQK